MQLSMAAQQINLMRITLLRITLLRITLLRITLLRIALLRILLRITLLINTLLRNTLLRITLLRIHYPSPTVPQCSTRNLACTVLCPYEQPSITAVLQTADPSCNLPK